MSPANFPSVPHAGWRGGVRLLVAVVLALLLPGGWALTGLGAHLGPAIAHAAPVEAAPLTVHLSSITPSSPAPSDTLRITGRVTNTSEVPITEVQVHLWRSTDPVADSAALDEVLSSAADNPLGRRMVQAQAGNIFNVTTVGQQPSQGNDRARSSLDPGQSVEFDVRGAVTGADSLGFQQPGTYLAGVQVRGIPRGQANQTVGRARAFVVVGSADATREPVSTVGVALLTSRPSRVGDAVLADDHLATELSGRLKDLLQLAATPGATMVLDPSLYDEVLMMAKGYRVTGSQDNQATVRGQQVAKAWLQAVDKLVAGGQAYRTPYGSPDVALAIGSGHPEILTRASRLPLDHPLHRLPLAVVAGAVDTPMLQALNDLGPDVVLVTNATGTTPVQRWLPPEDQDPARAGLTVVAVADDAHDGGPGPAPQTTLPQVTGRLQAQQYVATRPLVTLSDTAAEARAELAQAPWRSRTGMRSLVHKAIQQPTLRLASTPEPVTDQLWFGRVDAAAEDLQTWGELVGQHEVATALGDQLLPQAVSSTWQGNRAAAVRWLGQAGSGMGASLGGGDKVTLRVVPSFVTSAADQEIPLTITNHLTEPIRVHVVFTSENPQRISVTDANLHTVGQGASQTVKVRVNSRANGQVGVRAQLATESGRWVGEPQNLTITATEAGRVGWIIIIASGVVFLAGTAIRIRQVQHERRRQQPGQHPG